MIQQLVNHTYALFFPKGDTSILEIELIFQGMVHQLFVYKGIYHHTKEELASDSTVRQLKHVGERASWFQLAG